MGKSYILLSTTEICPLLIIILIEGLKRTINCVPLNIISIIKSNIKKTLFLQLNQPYKAAFVSICSYFW